MTNNVKVNVGLRTLALVMIELSPLRVNAECYIETDTNSHLPAACICNTCM